VSNFLSNPLFHFRISKERRTEKEEDSETPE
jgi:hypothetical protein